MLKELIKKWWFWLIVVIIILILLLAPIIPCQILGGLDQETGDWPSYTQYIPLLFYFTVGCPY